LRRPFVYVVLFAALALGTGACVRGGSAGPSSPDGQGSPSAATSSTAGLPDPAEPALSPRGLPLGDLTVSAGSGVLLRLTVDIADTPEATARGLMDVERLSDDEGMVFLWDGLSTVPFWMKDTRIPLDVAFWDEKGRIFDIQQMQPCKVPEGQQAEAVCPLYRPSGPYVGALEVNLGLLDRNGVRPGATVELTRR
jgi:uncharacterized protein